MKRTKFGFWPGFLDGLSAGPLWRAVAQWRQRRAMAALVRKSQASLWFSYLDKKEQVEELREALTRVIAARERYGWSPEVDEAINAAAATLEPKP